ncbi:putative reverse transcriptase domain-containing protein [Tanacetum coccineum]
MRGCPQNVDSDIAATSTMLAEKPDDIVGGTRTTILAVLRRMGTKTGGVPLSSGSAQEVVRALGSSELRQPGWNSPGQQTLGPYVAPTAPVAPVVRTDPDDPSAPPYVMVRDDAARNKGDDAATTSDPQPSQPPRSLHYHLIMPPRAMTQAAIKKLVSDRVAAALAQDRATRGNTTRADGPGGNTGGNAQGQGGAPPARECTYSSFIKCNPVSFHGNKGAVKLCHWCKKSESVFSISECAERNKVKFVAATLQGQALTWWNSQVSTLGLEVANAKSWNDMKIMMREEFCPPEEIQRMEVEL